MTDLLSLKAPQKSKIVLSKLDKFLEKNSMTISAFIILLNEFYPSQQIPRATFLYKKERYAFNHYQLAQIQKTIEKLKAKQ